MRLRVWVRQRLPSERASHGGCEIGKRARPDGGEECSPVGRPLLAVHRAHRKAEHVRLETADERTARTTARQQEMTGGEPQLLENRNGVAEREADAFQHGPGQMRARMRQAEADERGAQGGIPVRRALALQIGEEGDPVRAGGNGRRLLAEPHIGLVRACQIAGELIAVPRERATGGVTCPNASDDPPTSRTSAAGSPTASSMSRLHRTRAGSNISVPEASDGSVPSVSVRRKRTKSLARRTVANRANAAGSWCL